MWLKERNRSLCTHVHYYYYTSPTTKEQKEKKRLFFLCPNQIITTAEVKKQKTLSLQTPNMKKYPNTRNHIYIIFIAYQFFIHFMLPSPHHHHLCPLVDSWGWLVVTHLKQRTKRSLQKTYPRNLFLVFLIIWFLIFEYLKTQWEKQSWSSQILQLIKASP